MSKGKLLALCFVWLLIVGLVAVAWKFIVTDGRERAEAERERHLIDQTIGQSQYDYQVFFALDQFSGYAVLRSPEFRERLQHQRIGLKLIDDKADYARRLRDLDSGQTHMAAFTIDALIKASAGIGDLPAVIVSIIDETRGADAMLANKESVPNVEALNHPDTRFVLTPDSPSETLARVVMNDFHLDRLASNPFVMTNGPDDTVSRYRKSKANSREVFVVWEPYVSSILQNPKMHVVIDSSRFRGRIVDVIVVSRDFLAKNREIVQVVLGAYFATLYEYRQKMDLLVQEDAKTTSTPLTREQVQKLTQGIRWKNTQENFAHFGIVESQELLHIEDMIDQITRILLQTGAIDTDPTSGRANQLYFEQILTALREANFHPGLSSEEVASDRIVLPSLSDSDWENLREVGELSVPRLVFARGTATLTASSYAILDDLVDTLNTYPQYYLLVRGNASRRGDLEANKQLAENRARAAADYLIRKGVDRSRIHAKGSDPTGTTSVSFVLGEAPY